MKLVIDTNIYCDFAEGVRVTVDMLATMGQTLYLPSVVIGELSYGFRKGDRYQANKQKLNEIIALLDIRTIDVTPSVASKYGLIYLTLIQKGRKIPLNDVWIAASCMEVGGTLLTRDQHFQHVDQIDKIIL